MSEGLTKAVSLDDQIKTLKLKKKKIEFYNTLLNFVEKYKGYNEVKDEVFLEVDKYVQSQIHAINFGPKKEEIKMSQSDTVFTDNEVVVLKQMVERVTNKTQSATTASRPNPIVPPTQPESPTTSPPQDKIRFAMQNRHLDHKKVKVITDQGEQSGTVVGLDAPYAVVQTDTGFTINATLDKIIV